MIPLKDDIPSSSFPIINIMLIVINALVFMFEITLGPNISVFITTYGLTPAGIITGNVTGWVTIFTSMFIHGGWEHIIGNMLYLFIFGDNVEDAIGHFKYLIFYIICGIAAAWGHVLFNSHSLLPTVGASGAVAGVLGAYLLLYPRAGVLTLVPIGFFIRIIKIPALVVLGFWIILQLLFGLINIPLSGEQSGGVAWFAHIGGFVAGMILIKLLGKRKHFSSIL